MIRHASPGKQFRYRIFIDFVNGSWVIPHDLTFEGRSFRLGSIPRVASHTKNVPFARLKIPGTFSEFDLTETQICKTLFRQQNELHNCISAASRVFSVVLTCAVFASNCRAGVMQTMSTDNAIPASLMGRYLIFTSPPARDGVN